MPAALAAPLRPILPFGDAVAGTFQQVDLVEADILAKFHDFSAEVPQHGRRTAVLAAFLPVAGLFHVGPALNFAGPQAAKHELCRNVRYRSAAERSEFFELVCLMVAIQFTDRFLSIQPKGREGRKFC